MTTKKVLFQIKNVKKHYPMKSGLLKKVTNHVKAVNGVSIDIFEQETVGVVGESGCGKSTFGRTILGLETLTDGKLIFRGKDISNLTSSQMKPFRKEMQMIFQDPYASLNPKQKIGKAIEEPIVIHSKMAAEERYNYVVNLLLEVGLTKESYDRFPHEFSGGQRQRIGIARALAINPSFIVCDEPVSALDVSVQAQVILLLEDLQKKHNLTYLFVSHDLGVVRHLCDRVMVMYLGYTVELAPVKKLYKNPLHPYTEALLSAVLRPKLHGKEKRIKITGEIPSATNLPKGCAFHTRCPLAIPKCKDERPTWKEVEADHFVACHLR